MTFEDFKNRLDKSTEEDEVRGIYATYFKIKYNTSDQTRPLYTTSIYLSLRQTKTFKTLKHLRQFLLNHFTTSDD
jgi:hypothetical protein